MQSFKKTIFAICISFGCVLTSFSFVHAANLTQGATSAYGSYSATVGGYNSTGSTLEISIPVIGGLAASYDVQDATYFKYSYTFNDTYSGQLKIVLRANTAYKLQDSMFSVSGGWFHKGDNADSTTWGIPDLTVSTKNKAFIIDFYNTRSLEFLVISPAGGSNVFTSVTTYDITMTTNNATSLEEYLIYINSGVGGANLKLESILSSLTDLYNQFDGVPFDYYLSNMDTTLTDTLATLQGMADYQIWEESVLAYYFAMPNFTALHVENENGSKRHIG